MAKTIKGDEIIVDDHLANAIKSGEDLIKVYTKLDKIILKTAKDSKAGLKVADTNTAKGIREVNAEVTNSIKLKNAQIANSIKLRKAQEQINGDRLKKRKEEIKINDLIAKQTKRAIADKKKEDLADQKRLKTIRDSNSAYKKQSKELADLTRRYKDLEIAGRGSGKVARGLLIDIKKLNAGLVKADAATGKFGRNVGNYPKVLGKASAGLKQFAGALGLTSGIFLFVQGLRKGFEVLKDFDEALADIQKTTGLSRESAKQLSLELSKIDTRTAIGALQELAVSAGRLGIKGVKDITGFVNSADKLFVALGDDINGTAEEISTMIGKIASLGGAIDEFGVEEGLLKVGSVINELAANTKATADEIVNFTTRVAGIANILDIPTSDVAALGATFADAGLSMEVAGTHIGNSLASISKNMGAFASVLDIPLDEFRERFEKDAIGVLTELTVHAKESGEGLSGFSELLGTFGSKGGARLTQVLATLSVTSEEFTKNQILANEAFEEGTSLTDEFNIKNETLSAATDKLTNAVTSLFLNLSAGKSDMSKMIISFVDGLTAVINLANGIEQTDEALLNLPFGDTIVAIKNFKETWLSAFDSVEDFKFAIGDTIDIIISLVTNIVTFGAGIDDFTGKYWGLNRVVDKHNATQREAIRITTIAQIGIKKYGQAVTEYTAKEQARITALTEGNLTQEQRNVLIADLNEKYPDLLENYDLENLSQEDAIRLNKELQKEIINTAILKQKALAINFLNLEVEKELNKIEKISNADVKKQKLEELEFTKNIQLARIDAIEEETRIRLGLKVLEKDEINDLNDEIVENAIDNDGKRLESFKSTSEKIIDQAEIEEKRLHDLRSQRNKDFDTNEKDNEKIRSTNAQNEQNRVDKQNTSQEKFEEQRREKEKQAELARQQQLKDNLSTLVDAFKIATDRISQNLDDSIQRGRDKIGESEGLINDLKTQAIAGNLDAQQSIKAEQQKIANEKAKIEELEKKKRDLLIVVAGLELLSQKINSGDSNATASASGELSGFIDGLKGFYKGTKTTLGADLSNSFSLGSGDDSEIIRADKREMIVGVDNMAKMPKGITQDEVVRRVNLADNGMFQGVNAVRNVTSQAIFNDSRIVNAMNRVETAIEKIDIPVRNSDYNALTKIFKDQTKSQGKTINTYIKVKNSMF